MFFKYDRGDSYRDASEQTWITIMVIVYFFCVGMLIESAVLFVRDYWPAPFKDDFDIIIASANKIKTTDEDLFLNNDHYSNMFQLYGGRPGPEDMLMDAKLASAPGLFICGPTGLTQLVRAAVGQENSPYSFRTRYAIYEEAFEM